jgi:pyruvate dehydrogenase E2 component (dihydrolipoamide acetyltransferase)
MKGQPTVVLLHGQPGAASDWDPVLPHLSGLHVLAVTRPGYDGTPAGGFGVNAAAVLRLLDHEQVQRAVVVGHSWGGGAGLRLALDAPERVAALVLLGSVGSRRALTGVDRLLATQLFRGATARAADRLGARVARAAETASGSRLGAEQRAILRARLEAMARSGAWQAYAVEQRAFVHEAAALARQLEEVAVPAVVVAGTRDVIVSRRAQRDLAAQLPRAELVEHPGGHLVQLEAPQVVAQAVRRAVELSALADVDPPRTAYPAATGQ